MVFKVALEQFLRGWWVAYMSRKRAGCQSELAIKETNNSQVPSVWLLKTNVWTFCFHFDASDKPEKFYRILLTLVSEHVSFNDFQLEKRLFPRSHLIKISTVVMSVLESRVTSLSRKVPVVLPKSDLAMSFITISINLFKFILDRSGEMGCFGLVPTKSPNSLLFTRLGVPQWYMLVTSRSHCNPGTTMSFIEATTAFCTISWCFCLHWSNHIINLSGEKTFSYVSLNNLSGNSLVVI